MSNLGEPMTVSSKLKKQTLLAVCLGLFLGSLMVFVAVWSKTLTHLEEQKEGSTPVDSGAEPSAK